MPDWGNPARFPDWRTSHRTAWSWVRRDVSRRMLRHLVGFRSRSPAIAGTWSPDLCASEEADVPHSRFVPAASASGHLHRSRQALMPDLNSRSGLPRLYRPDEVAESLGCSEWWVKDRARRRLIPFTRVGRAYRFTAEHFAEVVRLREDGPSSTPTPAPNTPPSPPAPRRRQKETPVTRLRARPPRRTQDRQQGTTAA